MIVQTGATQKDLVDSYPELMGRVEVVPPPLPEWPATLGGRHVLSSDQGLTLFCPGAGYPHKNHRLLSRMDESTARSVGNGLRELWITLNPGESIGDTVAATWLRNLGRLPHREVRDRYRSCDGLFFPSLMESFGLPLLEAMWTGLPIVCSDLPYARWMCEDSALYFDPMDSHSAWAAIGELRRRLQAGWTPDYTRPLMKFSRDWEAVAARFADLATEEAPPVIA
jgi:glycosyltransferase involved in cell wall biosynthesis